MDFRFPDNNPQNREVGIGLFLSTLIFPTIFAWLFLRRGYSTRARLLAFGWCAFITISVVSNYLRDVYDWPPRTTVLDQANAQVEIPGEEQHQHPRVTARQFELLQPGYVTYSFVKSLWGPGELQVSGFEGQFKTEIYTWKNRDGSFMTLQFQNDKLVIKSQAGLN